MLIKIVCIESLNVSGQSQPVEMHILLAQS